MSDTYVLTTSGASVTLTKNSVSVTGATQITCAVRIRPTGTMDDGQVSSNQDTNVFLSWTEQAVAQKSVVMNLTYNGQALPGLSYVWSQAANPTSIGLHAPYDRRQAQPGDTVTWNGVSYTVGGPTTGAATFVGDAAGEKLVVDSDTMLVVPDDLFPGG